MNQADPSVELLAASSERLLKVARTLASENQKLRQELQEAAAREAGLQERLAAVRARLELLIARLPREASNMLSKSTSRGAL
jgi:hypothetical protein